MAKVNNVKEKYKTSKVLSKYELADLHEKLPELWVGKSGEEISLRDLADRINIAIIRAALEEAGEDPLEGEAENVYRLLEGDDVSTGVRIQQQNRLERVGIDVEEMKNDFVTHQAVYTYLTQGLDISKGSTDRTDQTKKHEVRIQRLRSRLDAVLQQSINDLRNANQITTGDIDTTVSLQVYCEDCGSQYELLQLFQNGGCNCAE
jgi:hypothetical protein